jgi:hypothetical protein
MPDARPDLRTRDEKWRDRIHDRMFVSRGMIASPAFAALRTPAAYRVLFVFLSKCRVEKVRRPCSRDKAWTVANNGEITFTYREAREIHGMIDGTFRRAIDELVTVGFIDISHSSMGLQKDATRYGISDRWEQYGTPDFRRAQRPKRAEQIGFREGNQHGKNATQKDSQQLPATVDNSYA